MFEDFLQIKASPIQPIACEIINRANVSLDIKRDDCLHPFISGNKWRKLKGILDSIQRQGYQNLAAMGGRHSNFLHALGYICYRLNWHCQFYIRGFKEQGPTACINDLERWGCKLEYVDRKTYKALRKTPPKLDKGVYWLTEGGMSREALLGFKDIFNEIDKDYDYLIIASATGTSVAGLAIAAKLSQVSSQIIGISVLNNEDEQARNIRDLTKARQTNWDLVSGYELGGFAKSPSKLTEFMADFSLQHKIPLEPVYSGKSFYATFDLIEKGYFPKQSRLLLIHCGGLQASRNLKA